MCAGDEGGPLLTQQGGTLTKQLMQQVLQSIAAAAAAGVGSSSADAPRLYSSKCSCVRCCDVGPWQLLLLLLLLLAAPLFDEASQLP